MPAAAGWTVGIIATLSLIASVSPLVRWVIRVPREFVNDYIFNFPDTSFAWAFVLALLAAALAARKRIAWWILVGYMVAAIGWNVGDLVTGDETVMEDIGEVIGLAFHVAFDRLPACWPVRSSGRRCGAVRCSRRPPRWSPAWRSARSSGGACSKLFPGTLARDDRFLYALNRVSAFAGRRPGFVHRPPARLRQRAARPVRGASR